MTYRVVKQAGLFYNGAPHEFIIVDGIDTKESAFVLAEVATLEHAERIDVQYEECGNGKGEHTGFYFRTNNGTLVWYQVKENS